MLATATAGKGHVTRVSLVDDAYLAIRRRILDNVYPPGHQALEGDLAGELGISRTPVREALIRLANEGLVEVVPRHGMRVLPVSPTDMREIYVVLTALESAAAELLAQAPSRRRGIEAARRGHARHVAGAQGRRPRRLGRGRRAFPPRHWSSWPATARCRTRYRAWAIACTARGCLRCACARSRSTRPASTWRCSSAFAQATPRGAVEVNRAHRERATRELLAIFERYRLQQM